MPNTEGALRELKGRREMEVNNAQLSSSLLSAAI